MKSAAETRATWLAQLHSTVPSERVNAEAAVRRLYAAAGFNGPRHVLWFDSPFAASWSVALLVAPYHGWWADKLRSPALSREDQQRIEQTRTTLAERLGLADWQRVAAQVGSPLGSHMMFPGDPTRLLNVKMHNERFRLVDDVSALFVAHGDEDDLARAEKYFWGGNHGALISELHCPTTSSLIGSSFFNDYSFSTMADDEHHTADRQPPPMVHAAWDVARSAGMWWPFENVAILCERPAELSLNAQQLLHRGDGPAATFRDGWRVYAWNGKAVPARWIIEPETVPPRDFKGFDPTFRKYVEARIGKPAAKASKPRKPESILKAELSADPTARLDQLRAHAAGALPCYDRYQAGEHRQVWAELVALGADVRTDPHAADALAVAYETMRRVEGNVRTVVQRLQTLDYTFTNTLSVEPPGGGLLGMMAKAVGKLAGQASTATSRDRRASRALPHVPPDPDIRKTVMAFEKEFGALPLSLRAFYEVVGEVNLAGHHPTLNPTRGRVATDPLLVYGLDEGLVEYDEEEGSASAITIAPDDLHKADTSGGDPYELAIPDARADGELLNERHQLFFVDYLRLCFRFGGFPGYDGVATVPAEIAGLSAGLIEF